MKILTVFGTRPEAIKMAPIILELNKNQGIKNYICISSQHRQMLDSVLESFKIKPDFNLDIMTPGQDLTDITCGVLLKMREVYRAINPDLVLVHGDTTTAMAAAASAFYSQIAVGHVEAGLRTGNIRSPFPEEFNRQTISKISELHFAPTIMSQNNLIREGIPSTKIHVTGNSVIDSLFLTLKKINSTCSLKDKISQLLNLILPFDWQNSKFILITGHRRENFGDGFISICHAIKELSIRFPNFHFIYPVHLNPNVKIPVHNLLDNINNIHLIEPLNYEPFLFLLSKCFFVLTDSGGIQEEAPSIGKPVLLMRDSTERPEAIIAGTVRIVGSSTKSIVNSASELLTNESVYKSMSKSQNPYGNGDASKLIVKVLESYAKQITTRL